MTMRLQRFGELWGVDCARCGMPLTGDVGEVRGDFIAYLQRQGWREDANGKPLCPACTEAKGETTSE